MATKSRSASFAVTTVSVWLSGRLIGGGLLDSELGRRVRFEAFIRNGRTTADRATIVAVFDSPQSAIERREPVPQAGRYGVVDPLLSQRLRRISRIAFGLMIICSVHTEIGQQLLHPRSLCVQ
jgi:hypothetical protein